MLRARVLAGLAAAWCTSAVAADFPEMDIYAHCERSATASLRETPPRHGEAPVRRETLLQHCLNVEAEGKRHAKWRLRMIKEPAQERCIKEGIETGSYRSLDSCLTREGALLRR